MQTNESQPQTKQTQQSLKWTEVKNAKNDIQKTFGMTPSFVNNFPEGSIPGAWTEAKILRFSNETMLDMKQKTLIALAVGALIPCEYISYFEKKSALAQGITHQEQAEAIMMGAIVRHWSVVVNGGAVDKEQFKKEADQVIKNVTKMLDEMKGQTPPQEMYLVSPNSAEETYIDIEKTLGLIPTFFKVFPREAISAAWSEFKALQLNPYTALNGRQKELIGLAVAAQIPCEYCTYFHRNVASKIYGASEIEMNEAVSLAATARHWSVIFNSPINDKEAFRNEADQMIESTSSHRVH